MTCYQLHATYFGSKRCPGGHTQAHPQTVQTVHLNEGRTPFCTVSSQKINKQTNTVSRSSSSQTMLEGVCGCFMPCNIFLAGNSEVSLVLQCFTAELITYIVCECDAPECKHLQHHWRGGAALLCQFDPSKIRAAASLPTLTTFSSSLSFFLQWHFNATTQASSGLLPENQQEPPSYSAARP